MQDDRSKRKMLARLGAAVMLAVALPAAAQDALTPGERHAAARAQALIDVLREEARLPGLSAAVAMDGRVVWSAGSGFADLEQRSPARGDTVYRLASISKAITGVAVAKLLEDGKVDLDAPIVRYLPEYPTAADTITLRMLLAHTAGVRSYTAEERDDLSPRRRETVEEALAMFAGDPLVHEPGERYTYTTLGYIVIRAVVERITGQDFMAYVGEAVLRPAGMFDTGADDNPSLFAGRAAFYHTEPGWGGLINAPYIDTSYKPAGGGMVGTAEDLCRMGVALATNTLISESTRGELWKPTPSSNGELHQYGMGWGLATDARGVFYGVQLGGQIGTGSGVLVYPERGVSSAMIANRASGPVGRAEIVALAQLFADTADGVSAAVPQLPRGIWEVSIRDGDLAWAGVMILADQDGMPVGEIAVVNTVNAEDFRRFRVATATSSRNGGVRLFTVHHRWGVFPFDVRFEENGSIGGVLDRAEEKPWVLSVRSGRAD